jgi:hypothetical protein
MKRTWLAMGSLLAALSLAALCYAQVGGGLDLAGTEGITRFTGPRWAMIRPPRDFEGGCVVGFLAFQFSPTGYFVYNNRIRGSWRIDELGNLKMRARDGTVFSLIVDGNTLRSPRTLPFIKRTDLFQRCPGV